VLSGAGPVAAHAPLSVGSNEDPAHATLISSPEKSFVLYADLHQGGEAQYYVFPMQKGQILYGSLGVPGPDTMVPGLVILGPGIESAGNVPTFVQVPAGSGALVINGTTPDNPAYEPFTPQPVYMVAHFNITVTRDGNYVVAVFGPGGGKYSLAPGFREQFTPAEWLLIPWSVVSIHLWEGQSPAGIVAPMIIVLIPGLALVILHQRKRGLRTGPAGWMILTSGLMYLGGAAMTGWQMVRTVGLTGYAAGVIVTLLFVIAPLVLGIFALRAGIRAAGPDFSRTSGFEAILIGLLGLLVWAGLIVGPLLALAGGIMILARQARRAGPA